jgi:hypothetical protein
MKIFIPLIVIILFSLSGCVNEANVDEKKIDSDILVTFKEIIDSTGRSFQLSCGTRSSYLSGGYGINYRLQNTGNKIVINFTGIYEPEEKDGSAAPALTVISLGSLPDGIYSIRFLINESVLEGELKVTGDYYSVSDTSAKWIEITNPELRRIPGNTIWGHAGYSSDPYVLTQVQPFFDSLKIMGAEDMNLTTGDYTYFKIDAAGTMSQPENPGTENARPFVYSYNGDFSDLRELIKSYGKNSPLSISLFTTDGDAFYTWQLAEED